MDKLKNPEITTEEIRLTIEEADETTYQCDQHIFHIKYIQNKGKLIVYSLWDEEKQTYMIQCADWLMEVNDND
jgi:membrane-bound inhibitor of C-type lysozyme